LVNLNSISAAELALDAGVSERSLRRQFKAETGISVGSIASCELTGFPFPALTAITALTALFACASLCTCLSQNNECVAASLSFLLFSYWLVAPIITVVVAAKNNNHHIRSGRDKSRFNIWATPVS